MNIKFLFLRLWTKRFHIVRMLNIIYTWLHIVEYYSMPISNIFLFTQSIISVWIYCVHFIFFRIKKKKNFNFFKSTINKHNFKLQLNWNFHAHVFLLLGIEINSIAIIKKSWRNFSYQKKAIDLNAFELYFRIYWMRIENVPCVLKNLSFFFAFGRKKKLKTRKFSTIISWLISYKKNKSDFNGFFFLL